MAYKSKQFFFGLIKLIVVISAFLVIYNKLFHGDALSWNDFKMTLIESAIFNSYSILILLVLSFLNWLFEILKWQRLIAVIKPISFFESFKQCTSSLAASLITPNRIGEYGAKALFYKSKQRKTILGLNFLGNTSQLASTLLFGVFGLTYIIKNHGYSLNLTNSQIIGICVLLVFITLISIWIFKRKKQHLKLGVFNKQMLFETLFLSVLRYIIFSYQFYLLLHFFNLEITYWTALAFISSMYLIASVIPAISLFDVVIKSSVAISVFSLLGFQALPILSITLVMWLLNFALPAIIGSYFVLTFKTHTTNS